MKRDLFTRVPRPVEHCLLKDDKIDKRPVIRLSGETFSKPQIE